MGWEKHVSVVEKQRLLWSNAPGRSRLVGREWEDSKAGFLLPLSLQALPQGTLNPQLHPRHENDPIPGVGHVSGANTPSALVAVSWL